jgi:hypothetical protein
MRQRVEFWRAWIDQEAGIQTNRSGGAAWAFRRSLIQVYGGRGGSRIQGGFRVRARDSQGLGGTVTPTKVLWPY